MKKEVADRWVAALRSGQYKQSKNRLKSRRNGFCCLGVLCDIMKEEVGGRWKRSGNRLMFSVDKQKPDCIGSNLIDGSSTMLPMAVATAAELQNVNPFVVLDKQDSVTCLTVVNDKAKLTFGQIADLIEKQWRDM